MYRLVFAPALLTLAACAIEPLEVPDQSSFAANGPTAESGKIASSAGEAGAQATGTAAVPTTAEETVDIKDLDNGLVCKYEKRPGSRIAEQYCYTREEHAANKEEQDALVREQMHTLSMEQEARMNRERELARSRGGVLTY